MNSSSSIHLRSGPHAVLALHGLAGSPLEVRYIGKLLHRAGFSVVIPTLAGYSMGTTGTKWQHWLTQVEELHQALCLQYETVAVGGLSVGATLALALAAKQKERVQAVALWGVTLYYDGWAIPWYRWLFKPCYLLGIGRRYAYREKEPYGLKNERWRARVAEAMRSVRSSAAGPAFIPADFLYQSIRLGESVERDLARVTADTLIVHAADDETASPRNAQAVYDGVRAAHKRKILLGDSYHIITMDNERELVARETIRFFQQSILRSQPGEPMRLVSSARAVLRLQRRRAVGRSGGDR